MNMDKLIICTIDITLLGGIARDHGLDFHVYANDAVVHDLQTEQYGFITLYHQ